MAGCRAATSPRTKNVARDQRQQLVDAPLDAALERTRPYGRRSAPEDGRVVVLLDVDGESVGDHGKREIESAQRAPVWGSAARRVEGLQVEIRSPRAKRSQARSTAKFARRR
jgi:hypothetical protein